MSESLNVSCTVRFDIQGQSFEMSRDDAIKLIENISIAIGYSLAPSVRQMDQLEIVRPLPDMREWWKHGVWSSSGTRTDTNIVSNDVKAASADQISLNKIVRSDGHA